MNKLLLVIIASLITGLVYANRGKGVEVLKSAKMIDFVKRVEENKERGSGRRSYGPKIHDYLHRKSMKMRIDIAELQKYVLEHSKDTEMYEAIKELFIMTSDPAIEAEKIVVLEKLFGLTVKIDQLPNKELKITAPEILKASKEWSVKELVELEKILSAVIASKGKTKGEALLEILDPILRTQAERKCM